MMDNENHGGETRDLPGTAPHVLAASPATTGGYAGAYSALDLSVIRIHGVRGGSCACGNGCGKDAGKHPDVGGSWKPYTESPARPELLGRWFRDAPSANVAIICGAVSGVIVVDADGVAGVAELLRRGLPATWTARSGSGGLHAYFRHPGRAVRNCKIAAIGDLRGDGGYVVVPPSTHASGGRYEWLAGLAPWESDLAAIPGWLVRDLENVSRSASRIRRPQACGDVGRSQDVSRLPGKFQNLVRWGNRGEYESRSEADMAVCVAMSGARYRPGEVWAVMTDPGNAISEKYLDKGYRGGDYLELTISRAHEYHKVRLAGRGVVYESRRGGVSLG